MRHVKDAEKNLNSQESRPVLTCLGSACTLPGSVRALLVCLGVFVIQSVKCVSNEKKSVEVLQHCAKMNAFRHYMDELKAKTGGMPRRSSPQSIFENMKFLKFPTTRLQPVDWRGIRQ